MHTNFPPSQQSYPNTIKVAKTPTTNIICVPYNYNNDI